MAEVFKSCKGFIHDEIFLCDFPKSDGRGGAESDGQTAEDHRGKVLNHKHNITPDEWRVDCLPALKHGPVNVICSFFRFYCKRCTTLNNFEHFCFHKAG